MARTLEPDEQLHPVTVDDYHRMIEAEILTEDDNVELLDGMIIAMSPEGPPHAAVIERLTWTIARALPDDHSLGIRIGHPLTFRPASEPEPDLAIVTGNASSFKHHPDAALLVIEVAKTSRAKDRGRKARIYAHARIPEYWIVDLVRLCVEVRRDPVEGEYRELRSYLPPEHLLASSVVLPPIDLSELFAEQ